MIWLPDANQRDDSCEVFDMAEHEIHNWYIKYQINVILSTLADKTGRAVNA